MVVSGTRNACAISATVSPPRRRSVSAIRASGASAGWQQVNSSRNRSSSTAPVCSWGVSSWYMKAAWCFASRCFSRRIQSIARLPAVVVSQPPGLGGTPASGHFSNAATSASPAASAAMSMSPKRRTSEAIRRPYSSRKTRSTAAVPPCIDQSSFGAGSGEAVERTDLDLAPARLGPLGRELERHVEVGGVDDPETPDDLLGLQVGAVGHHRRLTLAVDDGRGRCRLKPTGEDPVAIDVKHVIEGAGRGERLLHLLLGAVVAVLVHLGVAVHRQQVVRHPSSPLFRAVPMTAFSSHHERHSADTTTFHRRSFDRVPQRPTARSTLCSRSTGSQKHPALVCRYSRDYVQRVADGTGCAGVTARAHARPLAVLRHRAPTRRTLLLATCRIRTRPFVEGVRAGRTRAPPRKRSSPMPHRSPPQSNARFCTSGSAAVVLVAHGGDDDERASSRNGMSVIFVYP